MNKKIEQCPYIPDWVVWIQSLCFAVLYAIWALPETILIRNICLITGALLSLWVIYQYRNEFFHRHAISAWLILGLFTWSTFHLLFLSSDFDAQFFEYASIWKRAFLAGTYGLGLGLAISSFTLKLGQFRALLSILYFGLTLPAIIYLLKYFLATYSTELRWIPPDYLGLYYTSAPYYIPKTAYVCFCLPVLSVALGGLMKSIFQRQLLKLRNIFYFLSILAVLIVFISLEIKNGLIYSAILSAVLSGILFIKEFVRSKPSTRLLFATLVFFTMIMIANGIKHSVISKSFYADLKVALDVNSLEYWKYSGAKGYPNNELGEAVSTTVYERISWGKIGLQLIIQEPFGYGLIERSFGRIAKVNWPDSRLTQSHSGWIDLTLGIGIPGVLIIIVNLIILLYGLSKLEVNYLYGDCISMTWCILISLLLMWLTTEISQKVYFEHLIFFMGQATGSLIGFRSQVNKKSNLNQFQQSRYL